MKSRLIGILGLCALLFTLLWAVLMLWGMARGGEVQTFEGALDYVRQRDWLYVATYLNAVLVTIAVTMLFGALYAFYQPVTPSWAAVGIVFVLIYGALNLLVYASQITVVPQLVRLQALPGIENASAFFLGQMVQAWPGSLLSALNGLAYAILGIPSIIFGILLLRGDAMMRAAGVLMVLNAVACIVGPIGAVTGNTLLGIGTVVGGFLWLLALAPLSVAFLRDGA
jgi:hypothetical protein